MADPIAIIGLAGSIISFIDFGTRMVSLAKSVRDSPSGTIPETDELDLIIQGIKSLSRGIQKKMPATEKLCGDERRILLMVSRCDELAVETRRILHKLKVRDKTWSRTVESIRVAFQGDWMKKEVDALQRRL